MEIVSTDKKRRVEIGSSEILMCLYSTILLKVGNNVRWSLAIEFLRTGRCDGHSGYEVARQLNLIRDQLSQIPPEQIVYDFNNPKEKAPWGNNYSPVITSCGNFFTTADGKDLLFELVSILCYAKIKNVNIVTIV